VSPASGKWSRRSHSSARARRDVFGNPFRPAVLSPAWLAWDAGTIPRLARAIYDERAFDRLAFLADALEEVGCSDAAS
jgi:hypothetical protein